jgi:hypothetical protein
MPNNLAPESARLIFTLSKPLCPVFCITMHMEAQTMAAEAEILPGGAKRYPFRPARLTPASASILAPRRSLRRILWVDRRHRLASPHQPRRRRDCLGELVQIDGSEHAWFETRGETCTLLALVEDAAASPGRRLLGR